MYLRNFLFISIILLQSILYQVNAQNKRVSDFFDNFSKSYKSGDFLKAEKYLLAILECKDSISNEYLITTYNNLGVINNRLGRYDEALKDFNISESICINSDRYNLLLADVFVNKARIYGIIKDSEKAIEYLEQAIKIYLRDKSQDVSVYFRVSSAYMNLGLTFYEKKQYLIALQYLEKSKFLKTRYNLSEMALLYLNLAKTYIKLNDPQKADRYFIKSIESFNNEFGPDYYRTSSVLFDYGLFLRSQDKDKKALEILYKALNICNKNYGNKHSFVSLSYKLIGDQYYSHSYYKKALEFYQKSLIAVVKDFNDTAIFSNPKLQNVLFDIRLLENLKRKAQTLEKLSFQKVTVKAKLEYLSNSAETIDLALQLVAKIRSNYLSNDSKIYLAENEKETYLFAIQVSRQLFEITKKSNHIERMYDIVCLSKSAILRDEIFQNELLITNGTMDSLLVKRNNLESQFSSFGKLLQDEFQKVKPDSIKTMFWKDEQFNLSRAKEKVDETIKLKTPWYQTLINRTQPNSLNEIQNHLKKDETLIEYFLSNQYSDGKRKMYIFTISQNKLNYNLSYLDSTFLTQVKVIKEGTVSDLNTGISNTSDWTYTEALYYMYKELVYPIEKYISGNKLIIIPDEEIYFLPFDAFLSKRPEPNQVSYDELQYLINNYIISFGYSSSLVFMDDKNQAKSQEVYAFLPDYSRIPTGSEKRSVSLPGAKSEGSSIFNWFQGKIFSKGNATESNFKSLLHKSAIYHLAMHSCIDSTNSKYSYLIFDCQTDTMDDGKLFNYEISTSRISSPMVVLSACNTGTGNVYQGEGIMSLTRGFILAGSSAVINTLWDVNDDASGRIMEDFYYNLSKGKDKDEALRMAKLNYIKMTPPAYTNPNYWAAYEVFGDKSPVKNRNDFFYLLIGVVIVLTTSIYLIYCNWFRRA